MFGLVFVDDRTKNACLLLTSLKIYILPMLVYNFYLPSHFAFPLCISKHIVITQPLCTICFTMFYIVSLIYYYPAPFVLIEPIAVNTLVSIACQSRIVKQYTGRCLHALLRLVV